MSKPLAEMTRTEFVYHCASQALAASFANPTAKPSIASMVRDADKLWSELKEWEQEETP
ncbi:MAG: hypothetical protein R3292_08360 [Alcanivorax sp.]|nr:hypothetical protein [Alcanivorax sp.]